LCSGGRERNSRKANGHQLNKLSTKRIQAIVLNDKERLDTVLGSLAPRLAPMHLPPPLAPLQALPCARASEAGAVLGGLGSSSSRTRNAQVPISVRTTTPCAPGASMGWWECMVVSPDSDP
jgi:hypothetical protein